MAAQCVAGPGADTGSGGNRLGWQGGWNEHLGDQGFSSGHLNLRCLLAYE